MMNMFEAKRNFSITVVLGLKSTGWEREKGLAYQSISRLGSVFVALLLWKTYSSSCKCAHIL